MQNKVVRVQYAVAEHEACVRGTQQVPAQPLGGAMESHAKPHADRRGDPDHRIGQVFGRVAGQREIGHRDAHAYDQDALPGGELQRTPPVGPVGRRPCGLEARRVEARTVVRGHGGTPQLGRTGIIDLVSRVRGSSSARSMPFLLGQSAPDVRKRPRKHPRRRPSRRKSRRGSKNREPGPAVRRSSAASKAVLSFCRPGLRRTRDSF